MTDAPERRGIWAANIIRGVANEALARYDIPSDVYESDVLIDAASVCAADKILRADHALALVAEAYEVSSKKAETRDHADGEKATEFDKGYDQACDENASMIRYSTPSDALAAREARDKRVRDEERKHIVGLIDNHFVGGVIDEILALIEGDQTDE